MSMLSEQCARLRSWADQFDDRADLDALAPLLARDLREAADTIISLRDRLQAAELGSGTCKLIDTTSPGNDDYWNSAKCSECGAEFTCAIFGRSSDTPDADYCPSCAKVVGK